MEKRAVKIEGIGQIGQIGPIIGLFEVSLTHTGRERIARSRSGSSLLATVRRSRSTRSSTIRAITGGPQRRKMASISFAVNRGCVIEMSTVGKREVGPE